MSITIDQLSEEAKSLREEISDMATKLSRCQRELDSIESLLRLRSTNYNPDASGEDSVIQPELVKTVGKDGYQMPSYEDLATEWYDSASGTVTVKQFWKWLTSRYEKELLNENSIYSPIRKLVAQGKLRIISQGSGRKPTVYEVVESSDRTYGSKPMIRFKRTVGTQTEQPQTKNGSLSQDRLKEAVRSLLPKSGRVADFSRRLMVAESEIRRLLNDPECKVWIADRGWLKLKEEKKEN